MLLFLLPILFAAVAAQQDAASRQLLEFKKKNGGSVGILTTASGAPVDYQEAESTLNTNLLSNEHFVDEMTSLNRERIPERVVHASGTGATGYFETTHDITKYCKANLFSKVGKRTPVIARFSLGFSSSGARDTNRETRALAVKFYTQEGNFDLTGLNTEVFAFNNPSYFSSLTHALKRNPATNLPDPNMLWDFLAGHPSGIRQILTLLSDYGMPFSYRHMPVYCAHTYQVYNEKGESTFMRFAMIPALGIKNFNATEAQAISAGDADYYARDLYDAIAKGQPAKWYLKAQILSEKDVKRDGHDVFDVTRSLDKYPYQDIGIIVLNKNPINHFAEIEQVAFSVGNCVPGILGAPDKIFETRRLAYRDAQGYRLGSNYKKIPVNCPIHSKTLTYSRDGSAPVNDNGKDGPNYYPNSFGGPQARKEKNRPKMLKIVEKEANNLKQTGEFYSKTLTKDQQNTVVQNFVGSLCLTQKCLHPKIVELLKVVNKDLATRVAAGIAKCT